VTGARSPTGVEAPAHPRITVRRWRHSALPPSARVAYKVTVIPVSDSRRSMRLRVRAPAELQFRGARHDVVAEDLSLHGCRLTSPLPFRPGEAVFVTVFLRAVPDPLSAAATVVWSTGKPPHHTGVAFAAAGADERERYLRRVAERDPALARLPAALRPAQRIRLGALPAPGTVLGRDELTVLRAALGGGTVLDLLDGSGARFRGVRAALETLRARGLVSDGPRRRPAAGWAALLAAPDPEPLPAPEPVSSPFAPSVRPLRATICLEAAREEGARGHLGAAVEWLQAGLAAAPGDPELSESLEALTNPSA